jgi:hypothetical protein
MKSWNILVICLVGLSLFSCVKTEGVGGGGHVKGYVYGEKYNALNNLIDEYDMQDADVYIIYGDDEFNAFDDRTRTSYDGSFEFKYLKKGTYTIFTYSKCVTCGGADSAVFATVKVNEKNEVIEVGTLTVRD